MATFTAQLINPVAVEEVPDWTRAMATTFHGDPHGPAMARRIDVLRRAWDPDRAWGARDRGRWVATLRTEPRGFTVPGPDDGTIDLTVDALTNVTVAATHRRRGLLSAMLGQSLRAAHNRGDALSVLIAAEWPIYGRYGYAPAVLSADYELRTGRPGGTCDGDPSRVRQVAPGEFADVAEAVFAAARRRRAGQIDRDARWWNRVLGRDGYDPMEDGPHNWLVHEGDDGPDGLLAWRTSGNFGLLPPYATVEVWDLTSVGETAYRNLWAYLSGIDGVDQVRVANRPVDEPLRWLLPDGRALVTTRVVDLVWLRLLDVPAALCARRYAVPGEVILEVVDDSEPSFASGRFRLTADGATVTCEPTTQAADLELTQRGLASIYLGGITLREQQIAGVARELSPGALHRVDLMFSTPSAPWNATWF
ncbi:MAG: GNAT family N-acetyltransferase [Solirubrobacteraceae bacterium]